MKRTYLLTGRTAVPASAKSKYPTWLIARIAPPSFGIFSTPAKSKRNFKYFQKDLINTTTGG
jgi:hypothetical protein